MHLVTVIRLNENNKLNALIGVKLKIEKPEKKVPTIHKIIAYFKSKLIANKVN